MDVSFNDLFEEYTVQELFPNGAPLICLLSLTQCGQSQSEVQVV